MLFPKRLSCRPMREEAARHRNRYVKPCVTALLLEDDILLGSPEFSVYEQNAFDGDSILADDGDTIEEQL